MIMIMMQWLLYISDICGRDSSDNDDNENCIDLL